MAPHRGPAQRAGGLRTHVTGSLHRLVGPLVAVRWPLLVVLTVVDGVLSRRATPPDLALFAGHGRDLLAGHLDTVYADAANQGGPWQALCAWLVLPSAAFGADLLWLHVLGNLAVLVAVVLGTRLLRVRDTGVPSPALELVVGAVVVLFLAPGDLWNGHLSQVAVPALWLASGLSARAGRPALAGLLVGLAAGFEPWGVLAGPLLLAARDRRQVVLAGGVAVATVVATYLPFVLTGHFTMLDHVWPVYEGTLVALLQPAADGFSWWLRLLQGAGSAGACAVVVILLRRRSPIEQVWLAVTATVLVRVALDPTMFSYYWNPAALACLIGLGTVDRRREPRLAVVVALLSYAPYLRYGPSTLPVLAASLVLVVTAVLLARRGPGVGPVEGRDPLVLARPEALEAA